MFRSKGERPREEGKREEEPSLSFVGGLSCLEIAEESAELKKSAQTSHSLHKVGNGLNLDGVNKKESGCKECDPPNSRWI